MKGGCSSPGKDHWYLALKKENNLWVRDLELWLKLGLGLGVKIEVRIDLG